MKLIPDWIHEGNNYIHDVFWTGISSLSFYLCYMSKFWILAEKQLMHSIDPNDEIELAPIQLANLSLLLTCL